jgi:hypothetical protein
LLGFLPRRNEREAGKKPNNPSAVVPICTGKSVAQS